MNATNLVCTIPFTSAVLAVLASVTGAHPRQDSGAASEERGRTPIVLAGAGRFVEGAEFEEGPLEEGLPLPGGPPPRRVEVAGRSEAAADDPHFLGFAGGRFYPDLEERLDARLAAALPPAFADGRPEDVTWAYALLSRRLRARDVPELEALGAEVLGLFPHHALVLRVPPARLDAIVDHPAVGWLGLPRPWQKLEPALLERLVQQGASSSERVDLIVNVFESDLCASSERLAAGSVVECAPGGERSVGNQDALPMSWRTNGWQQRALELRGADVRAWREGIRAFRVSLPLDRLQEVAALDFVVYVERSNPIRVVHEESIPMIAGDLTRVDYAGHDDFGVSVGIIDSGLHTAHLGLDHFYAVGWDFSGDILNDPFIDFCGHGSHVGGTFFGNASIEPTYQGMCPDVGWTQTRRVYNAKILDSFCGGVGVDLDNIFDKMHAVYIDSSGFPSPPPMVVNNSWSSDLAPQGWIGTEANARALDTEVYNHRQLYVFAAGNDGPGAFSMTIEGSAKNVLSIGNVVPFPNGTARSGLIANGSSRGPCLDGRFKPNVCAPGTSILSVDALTLTDYDLKTGTSMAAPHVSGLAAQLIDHYGELWDEPQATSALLMAAAVSRSEAVVNTPSAGAGDHLSTYGAGRVESYRSHWGDADSATYTWWFDQDATGWQELDFAIGAGAERLVTVMMYLEPAASAGASQALLTDLDCWIDAEPFEPGGASGDFSSHQSSRDNIEISTLLNPSAGNWRIKVVPTAAFIYPRRVGVCVMVDYGKTHPATDLTLTADKLCVAPGETVALTASVDAPTFLSSALVAWILPDSGVVLDATTPMPGAGTAHHMDNPTLGQGVLVGDVVHGIPREVTWDLQWANEEGPVMVGVTTRSENTDDLTKFITLTVDGTPPGVPQNLGSPTHPPGVWSNEPTIVYTWDPAIDELSDIAGYSWNSDPAPTVPDMIVDLDGDASTTSEPAVESDGSWFFSLRAVDACGQWGAHAVLGPILVDLTRPNGPWNLDSTTHTPGIPSVSQNTAMVWSSANDDLSGLAGYQALWSHEADEQLAGPANLGVTAIGYQETLDVSEEPWYFHLVAIDVAGNLGEPMHFGPVLVYGPAGTSFCHGDGSGTTCPCGNAGGSQHGCGNSVSPFGARLRALGIASIASDSVVLQGRDMPNFPTLYFQGTEQVAGGTGLVFGDGLRCAGGSVIRLAVKTNQSNQSEFPEGGDPSLSVAGGVTQPGETRYYQAWYRDPQAACTGAGFNLTNGVAITWWP